MRKFRVQFLNAKFKTAEENCLSCIIELKKFFDIKNYSDFDKNGNPKIDLNNSSIDRFSQFSSNDQLNQSFSNNNPLPAKYPKTQSKSCMSAASKNQSPTLQDLTKIMLNKNEHKLPLFYQQENDYCDENDSSLKEFIVSCLLDPKFSNFVKKVETCLVDVVNNELKDN